MSKAIPLNDQQLHDFGNLPQWFENRALIRVEELWTGVGSPIGIQVFKDDGGLDLPQLWSMVIITHTAAFMKLMLEALPTDLDDETLKALGFTDQGFQL